MTIVNLTPPTITGQAMQGKQLLASPGTWSSDVTSTFSYAYQWERCDAVGASCVDIGSATNSSYLVTAADVTHTLRVRVTATEVISPPPPTPPGPPEGPITISAGGTISGRHFVGTGSTPTVIVSTSAAVVIDNCIIDQLDGGLLVHTLGGAHVTMTNCVLNAQPAPASSSSAVLVTSPNYFVMENNTMYDGWQVDVGGIAAGGTCRIRFNRFERCTVPENLTPHPLMIEQTNDASITIEVAWNYFLNPYQYSTPEDVINIQSTSYAQVHDNCLEGAYPAVGQNWYSGGGIIIDGPNGHNNNIYSNVVLRTMNYGVAAAGGYNNAFYNNRIFSDGKAEGSTSVAPYGGGAGHYVHNYSGGTFSGIQFYGNVIGYLNANGGRQDRGAFDSVACPSDTWTAYSGTINETLIHNERNNWFAAAAAAGYTIGA